MKIRTLFALLAILLGALLLSQAACKGLIDRSQTTIVEPPPPAPPAPPPTTITLGGACEVRGTSINCIDASSSDPAGRLVEVRWTRRSGVATVPETLVKAPMAAVSFGPGLPAGEYAVDQLVVASDGVMKTHTYTNLVVAVAF